MYAKMKSYQGFFNVTPAEGIEVTHPPVAHYVELTGVPGIELLTSSKSKAEDEPGTIGAQRRAKLRLGSVTPVRCHPTVEVHPALYEVADVSYRRVYDFRGEQSIDLYINARKNVVLGELDYLVRIYAAV